MVRLGYAAVALAIAAGAAAAASSAIDQRQQVMKGLGNATKPVGAMLKGEQPFDLAKVQDALKTYSAGAEKMPGLFPADSKTGGDTTAAPKIWEDPQGFKAEFAKFDADSKAALTSIKDEATFKATFPAVLKHCGSCHETYRVKKS
jgi:cytochrome c556